MQTVKCFWTTYIFVRNITSRRIRLSPPFLRAGLSASQHLPATLSITKTLPRNVFVGQFPKMRACLREAHFLPKDCVSQVRESLLPSTAYAHARYLFHFRINSACARWARVWAMLQSLRRGIATLDLHINNRVPVQAFSTFGHACRVRLLVREPGPSRL